MFLTLSPVDPGAPSCPEEPYENISNKEKMKENNSIKCIHPSVTSDGVLLLAGGASADLLS